MNGSMAKTRIMGRDRKMKPHRESGTGAGSPAGPVPARAGGFRKGGTEKTGYRHPVSAMALLLLAALVCGLGACSKKSAAASGSTSPEGVKNGDRSIVIGFSQIGAESAWRTCNTQSMKEAAAAAGIQLLYSNAEQKQENQIKAIRSFIVYQVDVIVFVPIVQDGWDNVLREAKEAHIPVIVTDRKIRTSDPSLYAGYIGTDSVAEGRECAQFLEKKFAGRPGPLNIVEIRGTDGSSASEGRYRGFKPSSGATAALKLFTVSRATSCGPKGEK